jgi:hypothetical protein
MCIHAAMAQTHLVQTQVLQFADVIKGHLPHPDRSCLYAGPGEERWLVLMMYCPCQYKHCSPGASARVVTACLPALMYATSGHLYCYDHNFLYSGLYSVVHVS